MPESIDYAVAGSMLTFVLMWVIITFTKGGKR